MVAPCSMYLEASLVSRRTVREEDLVDEEEHAWEPERDSQPPHTCSCLEYPMVPTLQSSTKVSNTIHNTLYYN